MKVRCIKEKERLTVGKIYEVWGDRDGMYFIRDDKASIRLVQDRYNPLLECFEIVKDRPVLRLIK